MTDDAYSTLLECFGLPDTAHTRRLIEKATVRMMGHKRVRAVYKKARDAALKGDIK